MAYFDLGKIASGKYNLIVVLGPTACGKTGFSVDLAERLKSDFGISAEIVNSDSRQIYKYLDIGTAKITEEEKRGVTHHMIDVLDPKEESTAVWYKTEAERIIGEIKNCGNIPILVGGSMLYISSITDNLSFSNTASSELRPRGKPVASKTLIIGLSAERGLIKERIQKRTEQMFERGWVKEVRYLMKAGYLESDPGMVSCGYREIMRAISSGVVDESSLIKDIVSKTNGYAKRQMTWWRNDERIRWITPSL